MPRKPKDDVNAELLAMIKDVVSEAAPKSPSVSKTGQLFKKGGPPGPGRGKGTQNKITRTLKDAILQAAESVGEDGWGKDGTLGYLRIVAMHDFKTFGGLLGRVLPHVIAGAGEDGAIKVVYQTADQVRKALEDAGLPQIKAVYPLEHVKANNDDGYGEIVELKALPPRKSLKA